MDTQIIYIILIVIVSLLFAVFHYFYKVNYIDKSNYILTFLRFISFLGLGLLLLNPTFTKLTYEEDKPNLFITLDNSQSITNENNKFVMDSIWNNFKNNTALNNAYDLRYFTFGTSLGSLKDSLSCDEGETDIDNAINSLQSLYDKKESGSIILVSDGNQTKGKDYAFSTSKLPIYTLVVGDTIQKLDAKISQLNANNYAYLNNAFPVEIIVQCVTEEPIETTFRITNGSQTVYSQKIRFDAETNSARIETKIKANKVGNNYYKASISPIKNEENTSNNSKRFVIDVIDQKAKILLVSSLLHPDIGMWKRSIEVNPQRELVLKKPIKALSEPLNDYKLIVLYQPDASFQSIFEKIKSSNSNYIIHTGKQTDWNFLNNNQDHFQKEAISQTEEYSPLFNTNFNSYQQEILPFNNYPPIEDYFGDILFKGVHNDILYQQIGSISSTQPMVSLLQKDSFKGAVIFGENIWKWRVFSYKSLQSFDLFDSFISNLVQYTSKSTNKNKLSTKHKSLYYNNQKITIIANYVDENYNFNPNGDLNIKIYNKIDKSSIDYPLFVQNNSYKVNVSNLKPGDYNYTVSVANTKHNASGTFTVLEYSMESQFTSANLDKLQFLSNSTKGKSFTYSKKHLKDLENTLLSEENYFTITREKIHKSSLISWEILLGILLLSLALEWLLRKFLGKI